MKLDQLRKVIREEVRAAIKEELQEVLTEAVKIASTPQQQFQKASAYEPVNVDAPNKWSVPTGKKTSLDEMLNSTAISMTSQDAKNFVGTSGPSKPNLASRGAQELAMGGGDIGVSFNDIPGFDPAKATAILKAAEQKSKQRTGV